ncbi:hypothetical protein SESBI_24555, partial [Sesbania bispinosa]
MLHSLLNHRLPTPSEIAAATPPSVLSSWRSVWKDRTVETAYLTAWKRIQDKLAIHSENLTSHFLCLRNNPNQLVSHLNQWHHIVTTLHTDPNDPSNHLGLRETVERIKQRSTDKKRIRFEYTESLDVPAKEVPKRLRELALKHNVVLCIRQKYIRFKPFLAEVKDYACHRAGDPDSKRSKVLKREPYASKRCGCGFRIRAIVPIKDYNEKDRSFVYEEDGVAIFKLYAVHSGHEPGPLDGNARIMHRVVGLKGEYLMDKEVGYGVHEDVENEGFELMGKEKDEGDLRLSVLKKVGDLGAEVERLEGKIAAIQPELLGSVSRALFDIVNRIRNIGEVSSKSEIGLLPDDLCTDDVLIRDADFTNWSDHDHEQIFGDGADMNLIEVEDDEESFGRTLEEVASWGQMKAESGDQKDLLSETCKPDKWLKSILDYEDAKLTKPIRKDKAVVTD